MKLKFMPMATDKYTAYLNSGLDAHGNKPSLATSEGDGMPCRHCLEDIMQGEEYIALAYSPFDAKHVYAEVGPIFLHAQACKAYSADAIPPSFLTREYYMIRGYSQHTKGIIEGTGKRIKSIDIMVEAEKILVIDDCEYVHLRSGTNTCFACRIERV